MPDKTSDPSNALLIFTKWPEPGRVKTRLSPPLSEQEAAGLYSCMLMDTLDSTAQIPEVQRMVFFDGDPLRSSDICALAPDALIVQQKGSGLGERLENAFEHAFAIGFRTVAAIGADAPHMPVKRITEAFDLLQQGRDDVVFGPSYDGGYYLIAMNREFQELFRGIPWSSPDALEKSLEQAESLHLKTALLPRCFDLDTFEDLLRLKKGSALFDSAHRTFSFLTRLDSYFITATS